MPNPNPAKLEDQEIAESRQKFDQQTEELCAQLDQLRPGTGPGVQMLLKMAYEQAERDTRERDAQLAEKCARELEMAAPLKCMTSESIELRNLAERIRGKGETNV